MTNNYPSYRYHPEGYLALVYTPGQDVQLIGWLNSPPEGFKMPKQAHFHGLEKIPAELLKCSAEELVEEVDDTSEPVVDPQVIADKEASDLAARMKGMNAWDRARERAKGTAKQVEMNRRNLAKKKGYKL